MKRGTQVTVDAKMFYFTYLQFTGMPLNGNKQIYQLNIISLRIPTGGRQTS